MICETPGCNATNFEIPSLETRMIPDPLPASGHRTVMTMVPFCVRCGQSQTPLELTVLERPTIGSARQGFQNTQPRIKYVTLSS